MSDFLKQFEGASYHSEGELPAEQTGHGIESAEHTAKKDEQYHKRTIIRWAIIAGTMTLLCISAFLIFRMANQVTVKNFTGTPIADAKTWGLTNRISLNEKAEFSVDYDEGVIISQDRETNSPLQKGSVIGLVVSKGSDPDELINLPDFTTMTTAEIRIWKQDVKALNANINEIFDNKIAAGQFVRKEFTDNAITGDTYTRKDGLLIYMSKGKEVFEKNIVVPDFTNKSKDELQSWAQEQDIQVTYKEAASDSVPLDCVVSQSRAPGKKLAKQDSMSVTLSLGKSVTVPNFATIPAEEAAEVPGLQVRILKRYSSKVAYGKRISQSEPAGKKLVGETPQVTVTYSLGRPYIDNLTGESQGTLPEYFYNFTSRGTSISYTITKVKSSEPKGTIVGMSPYGQFVGLKANIRISVSRGK
ncbi:MAG: PASTA domain-containing protein [Actinomycetes bacterium]|jgi:serine/threonine-protein kinase|nr:PASTA domain-containing protein [Actinomycetes bacterium]